MMARLALVALAALLPAASAARPAVAVGDIKAVDAKPQRFNEYVTLPGHKVKNDFTLKQPKDYVNKDDLPKSYSWANVNGKSLVTKSLNQHIPQCALRFWKGGGEWAPCARTHITHGQGPTTLARTPCQTAARAGPTAPPRRLPTALRSLATARALTSTWLSSISSVRCFASDDAKGPYPSALALTRLPPPTLRRLRHGGGRFVPRRQPPRRLRVCEAERVLAVRHVPAVRGVQRREHGGHLQRRRLHLQADQHVPYLQHVLCHGRILRPDRCLPECDDCRIRTGCWRD